MKNIYKYKHLLWVLAVLVFGSFLSSCSDWDSFKEYTESGEINYIGKMDSVKVFAGKGRVRLTGNLLADPKIVKTKIWWNDGRDSIEFPIEKKPGIEKFDKIFAVDEGIKSFKIVTYDAAGNSSVDVNAVGASYGDVFRRRLSNRLINNLIFNAAHPSIEWEPIDLSTGAHSMEVEYMVDGEIRRVVSSASESRTLLDGLTTTTNIKYRTIYQPEPNSIDTFAVAYNTREFKVGPQLKNRMAPFISSERSGLWGNLAEWQTNAAFKNQGGFGGWNEDNGNLFTVQTGEGSPGITNGKIWQTFTLERGTYTFEITDLRETNLIAADNTYLVVAKGTTLPDFANINNASINIKNVEILGGKALSDYKLTFSLTERTVVSMGLLVNQTRTDKAVTKIRAISLYQHQ